MNWQDWVISTVGWSFSLALLPSVLGKFKPAKLSCAWTGLGLLVVAVAMATLNLWLSCASNILCGSLWLIMFFQRRTK